MESRWKYSRSTHLGVMKSLLSFSIRTSEPNEQNRVVGSVLSVSSVLLYTFFRKSQLTCTAIVTARHGDRSPW